MIWHLCYSLYFWDRHSGRRDVARRVTVWITWAFLFYVHKFDHPIDCIRDIFKMPFLITWLRIYAFYSDFWVSPFYSLPSISKFQFYSAPLFSFLFYSSSPCLTIYGDVPFRLALLPKSVRPFLGVDVDRFDQQSSRNVMQIKRV